MVRARSSARSRSVITAARSISEIWATVKKSWIERALSSGELATKGPRPITAPEIAMNAHTRLATLLPIGPNRSAATINSGSTA